MSLLKEQENFGVHIENTLRLIVVDDMNVQEVQLVALLMNDVIDDENVNYEHYVILNVINLSYLYLFLNVYSVLMMIYCYHWKNHL